MSGDVQDDRKRRDEATSPSDVTRLVILRPESLVILRPESEKVQLAPAQHRGATGGDVELGEDVPGVGAQGVDRDEQALGDLRPGEPRREQPEHLELALAEGVVGRR
jgi:hypothetical protein